MYLYLKSQTGLFLWFALSHFSSTKKKKTFTQDLEMIYANAGRGLGYMLEYSQ